MEQEFTWSPPSVIRTQPLARRPRPNRERGKHPLVSSVIGAYSVSTDVCPSLSNPPNVPQASRNHNTAPLERYSYGHSSHYSQTGHTNLVHDPTVCSFPTASTSQSQWQPNTSPPQMNAVAYSGFQGQIESVSVNTPHGVNTPFGPSSDASITSHPREPVDASETQVNNLSARYYGNYRWCKITDVLHSTLRGIELESPRPVEGETIVQVRRDTCVTISFDIPSILRMSATYDGLKLPSTPSVRNHGNEGGKKLLYLQIHVLGATSRTLYKAVCYSCKTRAGNRRDGLPLLDFHARSNILVPQENGRNSKVLVAFTLACYSKHRRPNDSEYR